MSTTPVSIRLSEAELLLLDCWAAYHRVSRAHVVGTLLRTVPAPQDTYGESVRLAHDALMRNLAVETDRNGWTAVEEPEIPVLVPDLAEVPVEAALITEARASIALDGETRSFPDCPHRRKVALNGGMAKCADCGWIRRNDGRWYSV